MTDAEKTILETFRWNLTPLRPRDLQKYTGHGLVEAGSICHLLHTQQKLNMITIDKWHWYYLPEFEGLDPEDRDVDGIDWGIYG